MKHIFKGIISSMCSFVENNIFIINHYLKSITIQKTLNKAIYYTTCSKTIAKNVTQQFPRSILTRNHNQTFFYASVWFYRGLNY
jgi:hypothetical protein